MNYDILLTASARKSFLALESSIQNRIAKSLHSLSEIPRPNGVQKLKGAASLYRIRISDYRILYAIDDAKQVIEIARIDKREDAYRGM